MLCGLNMFVAGIVYGAFDCTCMYLCIGNPISWQTTIGQCFWIWSLKNKMRIALWFGWYLFVCRPVEFKMNMSKQIISPMFPWIKTYFTRNPEYVICTHGLKNRTFKNTHNLSQVIPSIWVVLENNSLSWNDSAVRRPKTDNRITNTCYF